MKKLLLIILTFLFFPLTTLAEVGDVYYCFIKFSQGVQSKDFNTRGEIREVRGKKETFTFKRTEDEIIFNKNADNYFNDTSLKVDPKNNWYEAFFAFDDRSMLDYAGGDFFYTANYGDMGANIIFASCDIY